MSAIRTQISSSSSSTGPASSQESSSSVASRGNAQLSDLVESLQRVKLEKTTIETQLALTKRKLEDQIKVTQCVNRKYTELQIASKTTIDKLTAELKMAQPNEELYAVIQGLQSQLSELTSRFDASAIGRPQSTAMQIEFGNGSYVNWAIEHQDIFDHRYFSKNSLLDNIKTAHNARFTTTSGRDEVRAMFCGLNTISVSSTARFPDGGVYVNVNSKLIALFISRIINACDFGERSLDHSEAAVPKKFSGIDDAKQIT